MSSAALDPADLKASVAFGATGVESSKAKQTSEAQRKSQKPLEYLGEKKKKKKQ